MKTAHYTYKSDKGSFSVLMPYRKMLRLLKIIEGRKR